MQTLEKDGFALIEKSSGERFCPQLLYHRLKKYSRLIWTRYLLLD